MVVLHKVPLLDLAPLVLCSLITCILPVLWVTERTGSGSTPDEPIAMMDGVGSGDYSQSPASIEYESAGQSPLFVVGSAGMAAASALNVTSALWVHLDPWLVIACIYALALASAGSGLFIMVFQADDTKSLRRLGVVCHVCQALLVVMVGRTLQKPAAGRRPWSSPEKNAIHSHRWVHMLCGGFLMATGAVLALLLDPFGIFHKVGYSGTWVGATLTLVVFGIILAFPLWHRHENPFIRAVVAGGTMILILVTTLLAYARAVMFVPAWLPGQILAAYALSGYLVEAQREMKKLDTEVGEEDRLVDYYDHLHVHADD